MSYYENYEVRGKNSSLENKHVEILFVATVLTLYGHYSAHIACVQVTPLTRALVIRTNVDQ